MRLNIEYIDPKALNPYPGNAKKHPAEQIEQIKKSILDFGFNDPVAVWGKDNMIIEGHGRLVAALELCLDVIPIIRLDNLTDEQRRAYTLVHNKLTMNSDFDFELLQMELDDINEIDMAAFGFDESAIGDDDERADVKIEDSISVLVKCSDENEAQELFERLTGEGYECKVSTL